MNDLAKALRLNQTDAEKKIWHHLRNRNLCGNKFRRQRPIPPYFVDFVCIEARLIVELDGGQHLEQFTRDNNRTNYLESRGFRVIRFWNDDVLLRTEYVLAEIVRVLEAPHPPLQGALSAEAKSRSASAEYTPRNPCATLLPASGEKERTASAA